MASVFAAWVSRVDSNLALTVQSAVGVPILCATKAVAVAWLTSRVSRVTGAPLPAPLFDGASDEGEHRLSCGEVSAWLRRLEVRGAARAPAAGDRLFLVLATGIHRGGDVCDAAPALVAATRMVADKGAAEWLALATALAGHDAPLAEPVEVSVR
jgi:hypothetical protein